MKLKVNGKFEELNEGITIAELLTDKGVRPEVVAVEINGQLVDREEYSDKDLKQGDEVEYLFYMGGGR